MDDTDYPADYVVLWCGSRNHPGGRQLFAEEEARVALGQQPVRTMRDLTLAERQEIKAMAETFGGEFAMRHFHISVLTLKAVLAGGRA